MALWNTGRKGSQGAFHSLMGRKRGKVDRYSFRSFVRHNQLSRLQRKQAGSGDRGKVDGSRIQTGGGMRGGFAPDWREAIRRQDRAGRIWEGREAGDCVLWKTVSGAERVSVPVCFDEIQACPNAITSLLNTRMLSFPLRQKQRQALAQKATGSTAKNIVPKPDLNFLWRTQGLIRWRIPKHTASLCIWFGC